jgi:predicted Zn-dependent protease
MTHFTKLATFATCVLLAIAGCSKPVTERPQLDQTALSEETAEQKRILQSKSKEIAKKPVTAAEVKAMEARLQRVAPRIANAGMALCKDMGRDPRSCVYDFKLNDEDNLNAYADGKSIFVTPVMMRFAETDNELSVVLGHEYAHNLMGHIASKQTNLMAGMGVGFALDMLATHALGVDTGGQISKMGASAGSNAYSPSFESEADYVGMYITERAGFDTSKAHEFWRKMTVAAPDGAFTTTSHPANPNRAVMLQKSRDEILTKKKASTPLTPNIAIKK